MSNWKESSVGKLGRFLMCVPALLIAEFACACAGGDDWCTSCETIFNPDLVQQEGLHPFFRDEDHAFYQESGELARDREVALLKAENLAEWESFFQGKVARERLEQLIYAAPLSVVDALIFSLRDGKPLPAEAHALEFRSEVVKAHMEKQAVAALFYLGFAKRVEEVSAQLLQGQSWSGEAGPEERPKLLLRIAKLLEGGLRQAGAEKSEFLKARYHYQVFKLLFYRVRNEGSPEYQAEAERFWKDHPVPAAHGRFAFYNALALLGGVKRLAGDLAGANHVYSRVFREYLPLRRTAYLSFGPKEEGDWTASLKLAKDDAERATLWLMFGLLRDAQRAAQELVKFTEGQKRLPLLVVRAVNAAELQATYQDTAGKADTFQQRLRLSDAEIREPGLKKTWGLAQAYLAARHALAIQGPTSEAEALLARVEALAPLTAIEQDEVRKIRILIETGKVLLASAGKPKVVIDAPKAAYFAGEFAWLDQAAPEPATVGHDPASEAAAHRSALRTHVSALLREAYAKRKDPVRALLLEDGPVLSHPALGTLAGVEEVERFLAREGDSPFDAYLARRFVQSVQPMDIPYLKSVRALFAADLASALRFHAAASAVRKGPEASDFGLDPFVAHVRDCVDCDMQAEKTVTLTYGDFLQKLDAAMKAVEASTGDERARQALAVGNAFCNISYFGRSGIEQVSEADWFSMVQARRYYEKALAAASDRELKARAAFFLAKTDNNDSYARHRQGSGTPASFDFPDGRLLPPASRYFETLATEYADTKLAAEAIKECSYYRWYLKNR